MRYNIPIEMGTRGRSGGGTDQRDGIFQQLSNEGHQIDIFSRVTGDTSSYNYGKIYQFDKKPTGYPVLIIENGPSNLMFTDKETGNPQIVDVCHQLLSYEGTVIYLQFDPKLPMVLNVDKYSSLWNEKTKSSNYPTGITTEDMIRNRRFVVCTYLHDIEYFKQVSIKYGRMGYWMVDNFYSVTCPRADWKLGISKHVDNFLFYAGNERGRLEKFTRFLGHGLCSVRVAGRWNDKIKDRFPNIYWMGTIPQYDVRDYLNKSVASISIVDKHMENGDFIGSRVFEVIQSRCVLLLDSVQQKAISIIGSEYSVDTAEEMLDKIPVNYAKRKEILEDQWQKVKKYGIFHRFGNEMTSIFKKEGIIYY